MVVHRGLAALSWVKRVMKGINRVIWFEMGLAREREIGLGSLLIYELVFMYMSNE